MCFSFGCVNNSASGPHAVLRADRATKQHHCNSVLLSVQVAVHYTGRLQSNGYIFDSSRERGREFVLLLGSGGVIQGWEIGLPQMKVCHVWLKRVAVSYDITHQCTQTHNACVRLNVRSSFCKCVCMSECVRVCLSLPFSRSF